MLRRETNTKRRRPFNWRCLSEKAMIKRSSGGSRLSATYQYISEKYNKKPLQLKGLTCENMRTKHLQNFINQNRLFLLPAFFVCIFLTALSAHQLDQGSKQ